MNDYRRLAPWPGRIWLLSVSGFAESIPSKEPIKLQSRRLTGVGGCPKQFYRAGGLIKEGWSNRIMNSEKYIVAKHCLQYTIYKFLAGPGRALSAAFVLWHI